MSVVARAELPSLVLHFISVSPLGGWLFGYLVLSRKQPLLGLGLLPHLLVVPVVDGSA